MPSNDENADLKRAALECHELPRPGKITVTPTKQLVNQRDLALAHSPGVAAASEAIAADAASASRYTARANLVGVVTNGTAVLGPGNIGPLAATPVIEGRGVLFKKFAGIDVFDIEPARRREARAHPHRLGHRAPNRQHDGTDRARCRLAVLT
jgi:malate dehydrogenase (oxaloacetate-decarboxylating)(NADP+)